MVMNCVNLRSMKPAKWLSSPRWMGHGSSKVRTQHCRTEGGEKGGKGREKERERDASCAALRALPTCTFYHSFHPGYRGDRFSSSFFSECDCAFNLCLHRVQIWSPVKTMEAV